MRFLIITKKQLMLGICALIAVIAVVIGSATAFAGNDRKLPIYCVETEKKQIAISFDAAWGNDDTQMLIDILKEYNVPATFFVVGSWVDKYPESVKALSDAGHQVQNHSNTHPHMPQLSKQQMRDELESCNSKIKAITGVCPTLLRPPYGDYNSRVLSLLDNPAILWSVDPLDWKYRNADTVCTNIVNGAHDGAIVLAHDIHSTTVDGVLMAIDKLQAKGYEFVTVNELFRRRGVSLEKGHTYSSCKPTGTDLGPVNAPTVTEAGGKVTITADKGAVIYYTLDGSSPLASGRVYSGPIEAKAGQTLRAVAAFNLNGSASAETSVQVRGITLKEPTVRALNGKVMISNPNPNSELRYTLDGSAPTERSAVYPSSGLEFFTGILRYRVFAKEGCGQTYTLYLSKSGHLFRDVPTNSWYFESIDRAVSLDLLKGVGDFVYEPDGGLNRAMFVTMLARAVGESLPDSAAGFSDVKGGQWYTAAMSWALRKNLIRGYEDGSYRPEALITREEMCVILDRLMQQRGETLHTGKLSFADTASISVWARDSVARMTALGLIRGAENNRFFPQRTTTRAEAATVMLRIYDHLH